MALGRGLDCLRALSLLLAAAVAGCGTSSGGASSAANAASTTAPVASSAPAPPTPPPPLMGAAFRLQVARAFAPQLRFNAYDPASTAPQNRNEDLFPMGVASFLREVQTGRPRVLFVRSSGSAPGESRVRTYAPASLTPDAIAPYPEDMVGDPPGQAPLYVHVYEDSAARALDARGAGRVVVHVEYWIFYAQDRADVRILGALLPQDLFGHQGDWEHVAYRVTLDLGDQSRLLGGQVVEGHYSAHGDVYAVRAPELELVNDHGLPDPQGTHPVVYVAQGKHGSYPQAGERRDLPLPAAIADYVDVFHGNGVVIRGWSAPLFDLEDTSASPGEFASPELQALLAAPGAPAIGDWTEYRGRFGPTAHQLMLGSRVIGLASSPPGPKTKSDYGDYGASAVSWTVEKVTRSGLRIDRDAGLTFAPVTPPPLPLRR